MSTFEYKKPHENKDKVHKIEMVVDGEQVGFADLEYRNDPFSFYYVQMVFVKKNFQGSGFGRDVVEKVNDFLDSKGKPGLLLDSISERSPAFGIYERHGWTKIPERESHGMVISYKT